jgi:PAS domain S-box-containing protein
MWDKIVLNLLSNAFKFTHSGGVSLSLQGDAREARFTVRDTGTGIPEQELPNLFQRFHRIEGSVGRSYEGSGIGLALVKELVELHGGAISVESTEGRGSSFHVSIPFGKSHLPPDRVRETPVPAGLRGRAEAYVTEALSWLPNSQPASDDEEGPTSEGAHIATAGAIPPRVVLADDNADMREYVGRLLNRAGFEVVTAPDGEKALAICVADPPDLVLTDVMMPKLDGFGLIARLRSDKRTAIFPSSSSRRVRAKRHASRACDPGRTINLVKPFGPRELLARARAAVKLAQAPRKDAISREAKMERLRASFEGAAVGMAHVATDGRWLRVNDRLCAIMGYSREELLAKTFQEITHPADRETDLAAMHQLLGGGIANYTMEKRYIRKDGAPIWANLTVSLVRKADGSTDYFVNVVDDITARKVAAIELTENRSRLSGVVESAMDAIISIDPRQNVVLFNSAAESMFQRKAADVIAPS